MAVLDASVLTGIFKPNDRFHDDCREWVERAIDANESLLAPAIALAETCAALRRSSDDNELARIALDALMSDSSVKLVPVDLGLARLASNISIDRSIRGCDAVYVALAHREDMALITLDRQQAQRSSAIIEVSRPTR